KAVSLSRGVPHVWALSAAPRQGKDRMAPQAHTKRSQRPGAPGAVTAKMPGMSRTTRRGWHFMKARWSQRVAALALLAGGLSLLGQTACATDATTENRDAGANGGSTNGGSGA